MLSAEQKKALQALKDAIIKKHGDGSIEQGDVKITEVDAIPTGALTLDIATGIGGIPRGRITELFGPESCGKTTLALHLCANVQKDGGVAAYIDVEHAIDPIYATEGIGVNWDELLFSQPDSAEQVMDICERLAKSELVSLIVVDSVAALATELELAGEVEDKVQIGEQARLMSRSLRKLKGVFRTTNTAVVFINQLRDKIGGFGFGPKEGTPGGRALKFYASMRIDLRRVGSVKEGKEATATGNKTIAKIIKNKVARPFLQAEYDIIFGKGISEGGCLIDLGESFGIVTKKGSSYSFGDRKLANGRTNSIETIEASQELMDLLRYDIMKKINEDGLIMKKTKSTDDEEMPDDDSEVQD